MRRGASRGSETAKGRVARPRPSLADGAARGRRRSVSRGRVSHAHSKAKDDTARRGRCLSGIGRAVRRVSCPVSRGGFRARLSVTRLFFNGGRLVTFSSWSTGCRVVSDCVRRGVVCRCSLQHGRAAVCVGLPTA